MSPWSKQAGTSKGYEARLNKEEEFEVIRKVLAGSRNEFRHLVKEHQGYVYSLMLKQVRSPGLAEELAQETFIRAYKGLKSFRFDSQFSTWLTRIALNHSKSYFTSRRFKESIVQDEYDDQSHHPLSTGDAESSLLRKESLGRLQGTISKLAAPYREVLLLCALEKKSYDEASEILNIPVGTVRSRLSRARKQVKQMYFEEAE